MKFKNVICDELSLKKKKTHTPNSCIVREYTPSLVVRRKDSSFFDLSRSWAKQTLKWLAGGVRSVCRNDKKER